MNQLSKTYLYIFKTLLGFWYCRITENVLENQSFLKTDHGLLCTPDLMYCFFEEEASNIWIQEELAGFEF